MEQAIEAYHHITAKPEFKEYERLRSKARHDEAAALRHAAEVEREKWQGVVTDLRTENENIKAEIARLKAQLGK